ncbi:MAG: ribosome silencing factor [Candidatus Auribacterota bacterium]|nr:ribosome silencing factor [Candidatus Auribacterota bacterium]
MARQSVKFALDKKCIDPLILDLRGISSVSDYFVICSGDSHRHVKALINVIEVEMKHIGIRPVRKEINSDYTWCILDYSDVLIHVFYHKTREFYKLERLWSDAQEVAI